MSGSVRSESISYDRSDAHSGVDGDHTIAARDDRVQVELADLRNVAGEQAEPDQEIGDRVDVDGIRSAIAGEQGRAPQRVDELVGLDVRERGDSDATIAE